MIQLETLNLKLETGARPPLKWMSDTPRIAIKPDSIFCR
jgi:hypothetical protein